MVDNWNFALSHARGQYVLFFTDKTFLLPGTISRLTRFLEDVQPEIVNWTSDSFSPTLDSHPFLEGFYARARPFGKSGPEEFLPLDALSLKGRAAVPRSSMSAVDYVRGKICFGGYRRDFIQRIEKKYGPLFKAISPDYTSMILALSEATSAFDVGWSGSVQIGSNISNGKLCATNHDAAKRYLEEVGSFEDITNGGIAPGVYASSSVVVAFDYFNLKSTFNLPFEFDRKQWLALAWLELNEPGRKWNSEETKISQLRQLDDAIGRLPIAAQKTLASEFEARKPSRGDSLRGNLRAWAKKRLARREFALPLRLAAQAGVLKSIYSNSLDEAVRVNAGAVT
jgi:hypothetical protein